MKEKSAYNPRHFWFGVFTAFATLGLIGVGGVVTSKGVGMAVPDWPNTYGYNMFFFPFSQWVGGILWEHSHRLFASGVGLLTLILAIWFFGRAGRKFLRYVVSPLFGLAGLWAYSLDSPRLQDAVFLLGTSAVCLVASFLWPRCAPARPLLRSLGVVALVAVIGQGILGGLRVTLFADHIGIVHASLAQGFFVLMCSVALISSRWWERLSVPASSSPTPRWLRWALALLTTAVLGQLILGASMRHQHAGVAVPRFPLWAYGELWPATDDEALAALNRERIDYRDFNPVTKAHINLHMSHRVLALGIVAFAALLTLVSLYRLPKGHGLSIGVTLLFSLICFQALLGAATVWSNKAADIATLHVVLGAVTLALSGLLSIIAFRLSLPMAQPVVRRREQDAESEQDAEKMAAVAERPTASMVHTLF